MSSQFLMAYIDPMAGSIVLQSIIAGVVGVLFTMRRQFGRLGGLFFARAPKQPEIGS